MNVRHVWRLHAATGADPSLPPAARAAGRFMRWLRLFIGLTVLGALGVLTGCASLRPPADRPVSLADRRTQDTPLGQMATRLALPAGYSGVRSLPGPLDAFAARVLLARAATRTLDVQYYIWHDDTTGILMLEELRLAARRGVTVRLLLDDNGIAGLDELLRHLAREPNMEIRLYNPFSWRAFKAAGYLTDFWRLNHRMHNKLLTADSKATVMGGRNIGDAYFGADPALDFTDLDVLAVGDAGEQATTAFEAYWNSVLSLDVRQMLGHPREPTDALDARLDTVRANRTHADFADALGQADLVEQVRSGRLPLTPVRATVLVDPPDKARSVARDDADLLVKQLRESVGRVERELDLVSAYFVPDRESVRMLVGLTQRGVRVRVVTNSLAATDVPMVHAGYARHRQALVDGGVLVYETRPDASRGPFRRKLLLKPDQVSSLHGKTLSIDGRTVFIGSMNFDPRSGYINTEMGLLLEDPAMAREMSQGLDDVLPQAAWRVTREGSQLQWSAGEGPTAVRHTHDPQTSLPLRLGIGLLMLLPIDSLL